MNGSVVVDGRCDAKYKPPVDVGKCYAGPCGSSPNGTPCTTDNPLLCASGICADGVCCNKMCGTCMSCNSTGTVGKCIVMPVGSLDDECTLQSPCGRNGSCAANGVCYEMDKTPCGSVADTYVYLHFRCHF